MADEKATFAIALDDETSGPANAAANALAKLQQKMKDDTKALNEMNAAMKRMNQGAVVNIESARKLQDQIAKQKQKIADSQQAFEALGGKFGKTYTLSENTKKGFKGLVEQASKLPGPLGQSASGLNSMITKMPKTIVFSVVMAAALIALTAVVLRAAAAFVSFGLSAANARRNEALHFEAISRMRRGFVGMRASSQEVMSAIDGVSATTATSREQVSRFAEVLQRGGVRGQALTTALRAASIKAAALGDSAGESFARMAVSARRSGVSIQRLAGDIEARFGGIAARRLLDLNVLSEKLSESFRALFADVDLDPLASGVRMITELFSQNTATGRALKSIVNALFQPLINQAGAGAPIVKRFFQGMVIAALHVVIVLLRLKRWFADTFGGTLVSEATKGKIAIYAGAAAFGVLALAAGAAALAIAAALLLIVAPFAVIGGAIYLAVRGFRALKNFGRTLVNDWREIGPQIIDGLVNGFRRGRDRAINAVRELGRAVIDEWKDILDIHSPSRVFASLGAEIPAGVAVGIDEGAPMADSALESMLTIPNGIGGAGRGGSVLIQNVNIYTNTDTPEAFAAAFRDMLGDVLEGAAVEIGAQPA